MTENTATSSESCEVSSTKSSKVVQLWSKPTEQIHEAVNLLIENYEAGKVKNMALVYTVDAENEPNAYHYIFDYWFAENSTLFGLGLMEYMKQKIHAYMYGYNELED